MYIYILRYIWTYVCTIHLYVYIYIGGEIEYTVECKATALFSKAPLCKPVACGPPPDVPNSMYSPAPLFFPEAVTMHTSMYIYLHTCIVIHIHMYS